MFLRTPSSSVSKPARMWKRKEKKYLCRYRQECGCSVRHWLSFLQLLLYESWEKKERDRETSSHGPGLTLCYPLFGRKSPSEKWSEKEDVLSFCLSLEANLPTDTAMIVECRGRWQWRRLEEQRHTMSIWQWLHLKWEKSSSQSGC